jgi:NAD(P)-dependent dehydrogenase (short-subunit alcohol dehydrogenase family)
MGVRTIVITGGFGSLGRAAAKVALDQGYQVALLDMAEELVDSALADSSNVLVCGGIDITDLHQAREVMEKVKSHFGEISALLNIAGGFHWASFEADELDSWDRMHHMNVKTAITASKAALPHFIAQQRGSIVCVSAGAAVKGDMGIAPYAASKAGVSRFVESLAAELKDRGIRVNAVAPSIIDTAPNREAMPDEDFTKWVSPGALAKVMLFLASDDAEAITGAVLPVTARV